MPIRSLAPKSGLVCSLAVVLLAGCESNTAPSLQRVARPKPSDALVAIQRRTVDTLVSNGCTGEDVALSGTAQVVFSITQSANGGFHLQFQMRELLSGAGLVTGTTYQSIRTSAFTENLNGLPFEQTSVGSSRLLAHGAGGDLRVQFLQHIVVDASGDLRVFNSDLRAECSS